MEQPAPAASSKDIGSAPILFEPAVVLFRSSVDVRPKRRVLGAVSDDHTVLTHGSFKRLQVIALQLVGFVPREGDDIISGALGGRLQGSKVPVCGSVVRSAKEFRLKMLMARDLGAKDGKQCPAVMYGNVKENGDAPVRKVT